MSTKRQHAEEHSTTRIGWLRAAVLGANDGVISTASLVVGVAAAPSTHDSILVAAIAALVAGSMSMAAGEYVSVSAQADAEASDLARERQELAKDPVAETRELAGVYRKRGLSLELADQVARSLMQKDALAAHMRDELGVTEISQARPVQAALTSAASFAMGSAGPILAVVMAPASMTLWSVVSLSLVCLAALGALGAKGGGASMFRPVLRVTLLGALAMGVTAGVGSLFGAVG